MFLFSSGINLCLKNILKFNVANLQKPAWNCFFLRQELEWFKLDKKWEFKLIHTGTRAQISTDTHFVIARWSFVPILEFKKSQYLKKKIFDNYLQKIMEKMCNIREKCNHKSSASTQLPTSRLKTVDLRKLENLYERKRKAQTRVVYPVCSLKI